jgi:coenzyme Q-binding protein COQ10
LGEIDVITANMTVAYKLFSETFTSRVELRRKDGVIEVTYLDGPFRRLRNVWRFTPLGEQSCRVGFYLDYEFRSRTLQMLMGAVFDKAFRKFSTAFEERAAAVYGNHEASASAPPREATITP